MRNTSLIDLFRVDKIKKEMVILKEPFKRDTIIKLDDNALEELMTNYNHFKYKETAREAFFAQDLFDETIASYQTRKRFKKEYAIYY